jgi:hypothetical protein
MSADNVEEALQAVFGFARQTGAEWPMHAAVQLSFEGTPGKQRRHVGEAHHQRLLLRPATRKEIVDDAGEAVAATRAPDDVDIAAERVLQTAAAFVVGAIQKRVTTAGAGVAVVDVVARGAQQLYASSEFVDGKGARGPFNADAQGAVHSVVHINVIAQADDAGNTRNDARG